MEELEGNTTDHPDTLINGITMEGLIAFPCQETFDPDPVMAMNHFIRDQPENMRIIGTELLPEFYTPAEKHPAAYCRLMGYQSDRETDTVAGMNCTMAGHPFASTAQCRLHWMKVLADRLALRVEVIMMDGSPLFFKGITIGQAPAQIQWGNFGYGGGLALFSPRSEHHSVMTFGRLASVSQMELRIQPTSLL